MIIGRSGAKKFASAKNCEKLPLYLRNFMQLSASRSPIAEDIDTIPPSVVHNWGTRRVFVIEIVAKRMMMSCSIANKFSSDDILLLAGQGVSPYRLPLSAESLHTSSSNWLMPKISASLIILCVTHSLALDTAGFPATILALRHYLDHN